MANDKIKGVIKTLNERGFGFITVEGYRKEIFFHSTEVRNTHFNDLQVGDEVLINEIAQAEKGLAANGVYLAEGNLE